MKSRPEINRQLLGRGAESPSPRVATILRVILLVCLILPLGACAPMDDVGGPGNCSTVDEQQRIALAMHGVRYVPLFEGRQDRPAYTGTGFPTTNSPNLRESDEWWLREGDTVAITMNDLRFVLADGDNVNITTCNWCGTAADPTNYGCTLAPIFADNFAPIEVLEFPNFNTDLDPNRNLISGPALFKACQWFHPPRMPPLPRSSPAIITPTRDATFQVQVPVDEGRSQSRFDCAGVQEKPPIKVHVVKPGAMKAAPARLELFESVMGETVTPRQRPFFSVETLGDPTKVKMNFSPDLEVDSVTLVTGAYEGQNFVIGQKVNFDSLILAHDCITSTSTSFNRLCLTQDDRCHTVEDDRATIRLSECETRGVKQSFRTTPAYRINNPNRPPNQSLFWVVEFEKIAPPDCFPECALYLVFNLK